MMFPHLNRSRTRVRTDRSTLDTLDKHRLMFDAPENLPPTPPSANELGVEPLKFMMHMHQESRAKDLTAIRDKVNNGHYLTRQAAEESARRMHNDGDIRSGV